MGFVLVTEMRALFWWAALVVVILAISGTKSLPDLSGPWAMIQLFPYALFGVFGVPGFIAALAGCIFLGVALGVVKLIVEALR